MTSRPTAPSALGLSALVALLLTGMSDALGAQQRLQPAFRANLGLGSASAQASCDCRSVGLSGSIQLQRTSRNAWTFGGELAGWSGLEDDGLNRSIVTLQASAEYTPYDTSGLRLRIGGGVGRIDSGIIDHGPVLGLGLTYDIPLSNQRLAIAPYLTYLRWLGSIQVPNDGALTPSVLAFGVGVVAMK